MKKIISKFTLITLLVFSGNSLMAQDSIPKHKHNDAMHSPKGKIHSPKTLPMPKELMENLSDRQKELVAKGENILREQRQVLIDMLSNIQKEILKDSSLSFNERKREIMSKMRRKQRKLVSDFENKRKRLKEELRKTLTKDQIDIISKHQKRSKRKSKRYD